MEELQTLTTIMLGLQRANAELRETNNLQQAQLANQQSQLDEMRAQSATLASGGNTGEKNVIEGRKNWKT